ITVTIASTPPGLSFQIDGANCLTPCDVNWTPGTLHSVSATSPQSSGTGVRYSFLNWTDGGALPRQITAPSATTTYTAGFRTQYQLNTGAVPSHGGTVIPTSGDFYDAGTMVTLRANPTSPFVFASWAGQVANSSLAVTSVLMDAAKSVSALLSPSQGTGGL